MERMKVHHVGYAVKKIEKAASVFEELGYVPGEVTEDSIRNIKIMFMENGTERIELVAPNGENNPVDVLLKNGGPAPYHICYEVTDIDSAVVQLKEKNWMVIKEKERAPAICGAPVAFLYNRHAGMIELVEIK